MWVELKTIIVSKALKVAAEADTDSAGERLMGLPVSSSSSKMLIGRSVLIASLRFSLNVKMRQVLYLPRRFYICTQVDAHIGFRPESFGPELKLAMSISPVKLLRNILAENPKGPISKQTFNTKDKTSEKKIKISNKTLFLKTGWTFDIITMSHHADYKAQKIQSNFRKIWISREPNYKKLKINPDSS